MWSSGSRKESWYHRLLIDLRCLSLECPESLWNATLRDWLKTRPTMSSNQKKTQNQSWPPCTRFPALCVSYAYLLWIWIVSMDCLRCVLCENLSEFLLSNWKLTENRSVCPLHVPLSWPCKIQMRLITIYEVISNANRTEWSPIDLRIPLQRVRTIAPERGWGRNFYTFTVFLSTLTSTRRQCLLECRKGLLEVAARVNITHRNRDQII